MKIILWHTNDLNKWHHQYHYYSRSQNNINVKHCNYKEITSSCSEIAEHNLFHIDDSMPNVGIIFTSIRKNL